MWYGLDLKNGFNTENNYRKTNVYPQSIIVRPEVFNLKR